MIEPNLDRIYIRDLALRCIVGINPDERINTQDILINITLYADLRAPCRSDSIDDTIDYSATKKRILDAIEPSTYFLIERLAERVCELCLEDPRVQRVTVCVDKPGALRYARSVAIEITRDRHVRV